MNLGEYLEDEIRNKQGREVKWIAEQINVDVGTLRYQLKKDCVSGKNLIAIAKLIGLDLNKLKEGFWMIKFNKYMILDYYNELITKIGEDNIDEEHYKEISEKFYGSKVYWYKIKLSIRDLKLTPIEEIEIQKKKLKEANEIIEYNNQIIKGITDGIIEGNDILKNKLKEDF